MGQQPLDGYQPNSRRILIAAGLASVAAAVVLACAGDEEPSTAPRTVALDAIDDATSQPSSVVRARGSGTIASVAPATTGPAGTPGAAPVPTPDDVREDIADEIGDRTGSPPPDEEDDVVEQVLDLVQGGSSVEDAVDDILGPPPQDRSFRLIP